jgi:two-component system, chemotaxis family, CheB/CheR fusion protein
MPQMLRDEDDRIVQELCPRVMVLDADLILHAVPHSLRPFCDEAAIGLAIDQLPLPFRAHELIAELRKAFDGETGSKTVLLTGTAGELWRVRLSRYLSDDGAPRVLVGIDDVSDVRTELRRNLADLLNESRHRIRNMLSVLRSLVKRAIRNARNLDDYAERIEGRLNALTRIQSSLSVGTDSGIDLEYLIAEEFVANSLIEDRHFTLDGPAVRVRPKAAETLSLAIHELWRNAVEHGCLRGRSGRVDVIWHITEAEDGSRFDLEWCEHGGPPIGPLGPAGYGREVIEQSLAFELGAQTTMAFAEQGLTCTITAPLVRIAVTTGASP